MGRGGVTAVAEATGMSRTTIRAGIVELQDPQGRREAEPAGVANVSVSATGSSSKTWRPWSSRPPVETLNLRCAGPARVLVISRTRWLAADIRSVTARWLLCFMDWTTVCRPTERRERGLLIPTATPSSSTSARKSVRSKHSNSRSYQSIRKRRCRFLPVGPKSAPAWISRRGAAYVALSGRLPQPPAHVCHFPPRS